jgi:hypothetical protein
MLFDIAVYLYSKIFSIEIRCLSCIRPESQNSITKQLACLLGGIAVCQILSNCGYNKSDIKLITDRVRALIAKKITPISCCNKHRKQICFDSQW